MLLHRHNRPEVLQVDTNTPPIRHPENALQPHFTSRRPRPRTSTTTFLPRYPEFVRVGIRPCYSHKPIVGTQAAEYTWRERYKLVSKELRHLESEYGQLPPVDPVIQKKIIGDDEVIACRPADLLQPEFEKMAEIGDLARSEETYCVCPAPGCKRFFERRLAKGKGRQTRSLWPLYCRCSGLRRKEDSSAYTQHGL